MGTDNRRGKAPDAQGPDDGADAGPSVDRDALIAQKLAAAKGRATPVSKPKKPAAKPAAERRSRGSDKARAGQVVGDSVGLSAVCRTSGCGEQGQRKTFRVPRLGSIALLPGGVLCLGCDKVMAWDAGDVHVERIEG